LNADLNPAIELDFSISVFIVVSKNNVPFPPPDNLVKAGKNSQIKARKSEHG
jgi:hypothetical protein